ncbi:MAG: hypothetical protein ACPL7M_07555 [Bryobacteraceae bacterium]
MARLAILYEHPQWFRPLFEALRRAGIAFDEWRAEALGWAMEQTEWPDQKYIRLLDAIMPWQSSPFFALPHSIACHALR